MTRRIFCKVLLVVVAVFGLLVLSGVLMAQEDAFERVREVQERNTDRLMEMDDVEGTAIGFDQSGQLAVKVFTARPGVAGIAKELDGVPVQVVVTGKIYALAKGGKSGKSGKPPKPNNDPPPDKPSLWCERPVPIGVSTGHPDITAGTIGCRVTDGTNVYALSNNHVYANENRASIGDNVLQPGTYDDGVDPDDKIGTLAAFEPIVFSRRARNEIDAAIALSSKSLLGTATPAGDPDYPNGYGTPSSETATASVGLAVQKYGRTTGLTSGEITGINATVNVGYSRGTARFVKQIIIEPGGFSAGGDSGSLIVTDDDNLNPVGLLFAGSSTITVANRIDLVLDRFGVTVDDEAAGPPPTLTSISVTPISATIEEGQTQQFTATGSFDDGSTADLTSTATWASSNTAVATVDASGLATGILAGTTDITATQDGISDTASLEVTAPPLPPTLTSISVTPISATIEEGQTQQFTATGSFDDGSTADLTSTATWESSNTAVATVDASGLATGILAGTTDITATQDGISNTASLEVTAPPPPPTLTSISVTPISATIEEGQTQQFTATGSFDDGSTADLTSTATWVSSNTAVATVDASGLATGIAAGTTDITATQDGLTSNAAALVVTAATVTEPTTVSVSSIDYATEGGRDGKKHLLITVALVDDLGGLVAGASVSIDLFLGESLYTSGTGTTGTDGTVTFKVANATSGTYTTDVTNVTAAELTWDGDTPDNSFTK